MNVLIADVFPEEYIKRIEEIGYTVTYDPDLGADELPGHMEEIDVLVVRSTAVTEDLIKASNKLSIVIRAGSGTNTINLEACAKQGVFVSNCPGLNSVAVAELAMAHILSLDRNIPDCVADLRKGKWDKAKYAKMSKGLKGRFLGIIGFGNIGQEVAKRAKAFEMNLLVFDPNFDHTYVEMRGADYCETIGELCEKSDIITIHVPFIPETENLLDKDAFDKMRPGVFVINTSRGGIIDSNEFLKAADEKNIRGGFDVFPDEPASKHCEYDSELAKSPNVYGTHHIGASTVQAQLAVAEEVVELLTIYSKGGHIKNCVNLETASHASTVLAVRHYDRVGVLAEIFRILKEENINVEDMENMIFQGENTACARIKTNKPLSDIKKLTEDSVIKNDIIHVDMYSL